MAASTRQEHWGQLEGEPIDWYLRLVEFYLPGFLDAGTLNSAYHRYLKAQKEKGDSNAAKKIASGNIITPKEWINISTKYKWRERTEAFKQAQAERLLAAEKEVIFDIVQRRLELVKSTLERQEILAKQFIHNYGKQSLEYEKTADALNVAKIDAALTESNEKALNQYVELTGLRDLMLEKLREQQVEV